MTEAKDRAGIGTVIAGLMLVEALTLAAASIVHFGVAIPLGIVTLNDPFPGARVPEAIIAAVVAAGAVSLLARWAGAWWWALSTTLVAIVGVLVGVGAVLGGPAPRPWDLVYHGSLLALLLVTATLLLLPGARRALR